MRIGCLQFAPQVGDVNNNLNRADAVLNKASADNLDLDLLVLPEMAFSGYNFKSLRDISTFLEPSGSGISSLWARTTALRHNCFVVVGYPEKSESGHRGSTSPEYYNSAIVVSPDGETVANYRKSHLYDVDEAWALESPKGFFRGNIPELGNTAIGICTDLNPYRFQTPWDTFEFAYHVVHSEANLVIVSMAWFADDSRTGYSSLPQEPDMEALTWWATRLEPVIRNEENEEVIVVFCNRTGHEDEVTYAGTSAVIGIKGGEVCVYGLLGRGDKDLLIVDTDEQPFAKMVLMAPAEDTRSEVVSSSSSAYPATSSDDVTIESEPLSTLDDNPEAFYTQYVAKSPTKVSSKSSKSSKSSSGRSSSVDNGSGAGRRAKPMPPKLHIPNGPNKSWKKDSATEAGPLEAGPLEAGHLEAGHLEADPGSGTIPTPSGPSPTPSSTRPKLGLPVSKWAAGQAHNISASPDWTSHSKLYSRMPDSAIVVSPPLPAGDSLSQDSRRRTPPRETQSAMAITHPHSFGHRRNKSRNSDVDRSGRSRQVKTPDYTYGAVEELQIRSTSFTRSRNSSRTRRFKDSPPATHADALSLSNWLDALPQKTGDSGFGDMSSTGGPSRQTSPAQIPQAAVDNRLSTVSRDSIIVAASPSVFQTTFAQPLDGVLKSKTESPAISPHAAPPQQNGVSNSAASSPGLLKTMLSAEPSPAKTSPGQLEFQKIPVADLAEESDAERPPSVILSPIQSPHPSPEIKEDGSKTPGAGPNAPPTPVGAATTPRAVEEKTPSNERTAEEAIAEFFKAEQQNNVAPAGTVKGSPTSPSHGAHASPNQLTNVVTSEEEMLRLMSDPTPSPASFTSSIDTMSPSNEVPQTPLDSELPHFNGPATPRAMAVDLRDDDQIDDASLSSVGQVQLQSVAWAGKQPQMLGSGPMSLTW